VTARDRMVLVVVAVLGAIAASWLLVISPKRDQASQLQSQIETAQSSLNSARAELTQGEAARATFKKSYASLVRLGEAVPTDDDVPSLIYEIQSAASGARVDFRGLTLNPAASGPVTTTPAPSTPSSPSTSATGSSAAGSTPSPSGAAAPAATLPPGAGVGPSGFPIEPFTFTFQGNFFHLSNFFGRLEHFVVASNRRLSVSGRLLSLDAINLAPGPAGFPQIVASVSATTYLLPSAEGLTAGATAAGPAPASTPAGSAPASPSTASAAPVPAAAITATK